MSKVMATFTINEKIKDISQYVADKENVSWSQLIEDTLADYCDQFYKEHPECRKWIDSTTAKHDLTAEQILANANLYKKEK